MEFNSIQKNQMGNIPLKFLPSQIAGLVLWARLNTGITVTGAGVSQWDDQSGQGNHLKQATDTNRPSKESDGSILFDGVDNYLKADTFTLNQPETIYFLGKQVTWTAVDRVFDGDTTDSMGLNQFGSSDRLFMRSPDLSGEVTLALDTYGVISCVYNNTSSVIQLNVDPPVLTSPGATNAGGFTLGAAGGIGNYSHIQAKEIVLFNTAHDAETRTQVINYLSLVGGLSL